MSADPVENVRQYLARDERKAKAEFTASLEGKGANELMAILCSRREEGGNVELESDGVELEAITLGPEEVTLSKMASHLPTIVQNSAVEENIDTETAPRLSHEQTSALWQAVRSGEVPTSEALDAICREMSMQECVVQALEKDNVSLLAERRVLRARVSELEKNLENTVAKQSLIASSQPHPPVHSQQPLMSDFPNSGEVQLELERERTKVRELQLDVEVLRRDKKELETRLSRVDPQRFEELEVELRNCRVDLRRRETEHRAAVEDMARKVAWYVEHQEFNQAQEEMIREQQDTIRRLRARLHEVGGLDGGPRRGSDARVRQLSRRVAELEEALQSKHPNSIAQLIYSCQPSAQDSKLFRQLNQRIKDLEAAIVEKDRCAEAAVGRLRVETDRMRIQYQERIDRLEVDLKQRLLHTQSRRVRELEKQLTEARQELRERVERGESMARKEKERDSPQLQEENHVAELEALRKENTMLRGQVAQQSTALLTAQSSPPSTTTNTYPYPSTNANLVADVNVDAAVRITSELQAKLQTNATEFAIYKRLLTESQDSLRDAHARWENRMLSARQEFQAQAQQMRHTHNAELARLQETHQREMRTVVEQQRQAEEAVRASHALVPTVATDGSGFLRGVEERLAYLEQRIVRQESEARHELSEVKRIADFELTLVRQKAEMIIEQKNQQISEFRLQLDHLLSSLALLQAQAAI